MVRPKTKNLTLNKWLRKLNIDALSLRIKLDPIDPSEMYDEFNDEINNAVKLNRQEYNASELLKLAKPYKYFLGLKDYIDEEIQSQVFFTLNDIDYYMYSDVIRLVESLEKQKKRK